MAAKPAGMDMERNDVIVTHIRNWQLSLVNNPTYFKRVVALI